jgi:hypothetical protein
LVGDVAQPGLAAFALEAFLLVYQRGYDPVNKFRSTRIRVGKF